MRSTRSENVWFVSNDPVQLDWCYNGEFVEASSHTNVVIAANPTAQARLKLFSHLGPLGRRVWLATVTLILLYSQPPLVYGNLSWVIIWVI